MSTVHRFAGVLAAGWSWTGMFARIVVVATRATIVTARQMKDGNKRGMLSDGCNRSSSVFFRIRRVPNLFDPVVVD